MSATPRPPWKDLLSADEPLVLPGAYDALSAQLIERAGFGACVIGGFGLLGSRYGLPDIGLVGLAEMAAGVADIRNATTIPLLVDADHGYGDAKNVTHTVNTYERLGVSALLIEDQRAPKRCGHTDGKKVVPCDEMEMRIRAAAAARLDDSLFLIARTDARAIEGLDATLRRAERYVAAGADGLFIEAPQSEQELVAIAGTFDVPQMCNMLYGGATPIYSNGELFEMGYRMIVHGTTLIKRTAKALQGTLCRLREDTLEYHADDFATLAEFMAIAKLDYWQSVERRSADLSD